MTRGTPVTQVSEGSQSKGREDITAGYTEVPTKVYRTDGFPTIFAGFQQIWIEGSDPETGTTFELTAGAGWGSKYATLIIEVPGQPRIYEYIDVSELVTARVRAVIAGEPIEVTP